jgi:hypothetical protein
MCSSSRSTLAVECAYGKLERCCDDWKHKEPMQLPVRPRPRLPPPLLMLPLLISCTRHHSRSPQLLPFWLCFVVGTCSAATSLWTPLPVASQWAPQTEPSTYSDGSRVTLLHRTPCRPSLRPRPQHRRTPRGLPSSQCNGVEYSISDLHSAISSAGCWRSWIALSNNVASRLCVPSRECIVFVYRHRDSIIGTFSIVLSISTHVTCEIARANYN